jgi:uncharacterized damage-inducible protein DinB
MKPIDAFFTLLTCLWTAWPGTMPGHRQSSPPDSPQPASQTMIELISSSEALLVGIAEAMPAGAYGFAPTQGEFRGVRTFVKQVKHVAAVHYLVAATVLGEPAPPDAADEKGPDSVRTKEEAVKYLKDSYGRLRQAASTVEGANAFTPLASPFGKAATRTGLLSGALVHAADHYGQMVVYLRMNGLIPPASGG